MKPFITTYIIRIWHGTHGNKSVRVMNSLELSVKVHFRVRKGDERILRALELVEI